MQKNPSKAKYYYVILNLQTAAMLFLTQPQIDTCSFFGVNRDLNMYSKACSAQWLHVYVAKLKVFCSISSGKLLENPPLKKDGNGSGGSDLILDNLRFLKKSYKCVVPSN